MHKFVVCPYTKRQSHKTLPLKNDIILDQLFLLNILVTPSSPIKLGQRVAGTSTEILAAAAKQRTHRASGLGKLLVKGL